MSHGRSHSTVVSLIATAAAAMIIAASPAFAIDEIIIKTRKTEENLQDVPIAITTVDAATLKRTGANSLEDITKFSPSFIFDQNSRQKDVRIAVRGLSPTRGRSNVAFLIDGIDVTSEAIGTPGAGLLTSQRLLSDVQQVEAVKGPQSALFGRAAFAGAINYVTKDAPDQFEASISSEIAQYKDYSLNGSVGAPISDTIGWLANAYWFDSEGQYNNAISKSPLGGGKGYGGSLTFNLTPTATLDIKTRFEYIDEEYDDLPRARYINDTIVTAPNPGTPINDGNDFVTSFPRTFGDADTAIFPLRRGEDPRSYCIPTDISPTNGKQRYDCDLSRTPSDYEGASQELFRASVVANWDVAALRGTLSSLTGYIDSENSEKYDYDAFASGRPDSNPGTHDIFNDDTVEIFSQEFRYRSDLEGPVNFTLGTQYWGQERVQIQQGMLSAYAPGFDEWQEDFFPQIEEGNNIRDPRIVEDEHYSFYALIEWEINNQWKLGLENRYTDETFEQERSVVIFPGLGGNLQIRNQDCSFTTAVNCFTTNYIESGPFANFCAPPGSTRPDGSPPISNCFKETPNVQRLAAERTSTFNTPKLTLEFTPDDDTLYYLSIGKAVKPAGIDVLGGGGPPVESDRDPATRPDLSTEAGYAEAERQVFEGYLSEAEFDSEKLWAYEIGSKKTVRGDLGTLVLNSALFFQDFTDKQVSVRVFNPSSGTIQRRTANAGKVEVWGVELESSWLTPIDGLTVNAAYTWLDAEYVEFDEVTTSTNTSAILGNCIPVDRTGDPAGDPITSCLVSRAGNAVERAPDHSVVVSANYTQPLTGTDFDWFVEGNALYQSDRFSDPENTTFFDEYSIVDVRFGIESDQWEALIFVDNLFEDDTVTSGSEIPDFASPLNGPAPSFITLGILPEKRQVGIRVKYNFK